MLIKAQSVQELEIRVNNKLAEGFICIGGAIVSENTQLYYQSLVQNVEKPKVVRKTKIKP